MHTLKTKHHIVRLIITSSLIFLFTNGATANTNTAIAIGNWENGASWSLGTVPVAGDAVIIPAGFSITLNAAADVCGSLSILGSGQINIKAGAGLSIGGNFSNAGTFTAAAGSTLTFNGAANSIISGGGNYTTIACRIVLNMGSAATSLDVQDANFISAINAGGKYYFSFIQGIWKMDNAGTLNDCYNNGSANALTIPYGVVIESDNGTMNLCKNAPTGNAILSGKLFVNGGIINVQTGQAANSGQDFRYQVNGGTPQLYISGGYLYVGAGFNAKAATDYIDFHMTGGIFILAFNGYSNWITFQLADVVGGKTFMSGGTIILQDACNANIEDIDMGGANVAATQYSVTGGTVQFGYINTYSGSTYFGINAEPATNYPNLEFKAGVAKNAAAFKTGNINMLSLLVNTNMTFDATGFPNLTILSNNGTFAFDEEGGFIESTNTVTFAGNVPQLITSTSLASETFYNLVISNTSGNVILGLPTIATNSLKFTSGLLDASNYSFTLNTGSNAITGTSCTSYIITGNGVAGTGALNIKNIPTNTNTIFPIGTSSYYLPVTINPGVNVGNSYAAFVFKGATTNGQANGPAFSALGLSRIVNGIWNISRTAGAGTATLGLNWACSGTALEGSTFQTYGTNIGISQYVAGSYQLAIGTGNVATETASSSFNNFTQFGVGGINQVLPILISNFNAVPKNNNSALLSWDASNDESIINFEVERSIDGSEWKSIGIVQTNDSSILQNHYSFTDISPETGINYYRLKIQSQGSNYFYSEVRYVTISSIAGIKIYPSPATNSINVSVNNARGTLVVRLINQAGQILQSLESNSTGESTISLNTASYASGVYLIQVIAADKTPQTRTIIINR